MKRGLLLAALFAMVLPACELITDPEEGPPGSRLPSTDFSAWLARPGGEDRPAPDPAIRGENGRIAVEGSVGTSVPCYEVEGWADVGERTVDVTVVADAIENVACITVIATFGYEAAVRDLAPGTYDVRLIHVVDGRAEDVLEREIVVE